MSAEVGYVGPNNIKYKLALGRDQILSAYVHIFLLLGCVVGEHIHIETGQSSSTRAGQLRVDNKRPTQAV